MNIRLLHRFHFIAPFLDRLHRHKTPSSYRRGIGLGVKGVAGRDALVHKGNAIVHKATQ